MIPNDTFLQQFGLRLAQLIAPVVSIQKLNAAIQQTISEARAISAHSPAPAVVRAPPAPQRALELVFVHDCRHLACNNGACTLCKHNPVKRCMVNFARHYHVDERLLAKCEGDIQVELLEAGTGERFREPLVGCRAEMFLVEGARYEAMPQGSDNFSNCEVVAGQTPLLAAAGAPGGARVVLPFPNGAASLPLRDVRVLAPSEAVLQGGPHATFRLVVRVTTEDGRPLPVRPAVSEKFQVSARRNRPAKQCGVRCESDPVHWLCHISDEAARRLGDLQRSAEEAGLDLKLPQTLHRVSTVREFAQLAWHAAGYPHMQQRLQPLLGLTLGRWDAACQHAKAAVQADHRMRAWYRSDMSLGLLYECHRGAVRPDSPRALVQNRKHEGADFMEVIPVGDGSRLPLQPPEFQSVCDQAVECWWEDQHPEWTIFSLGGQHFETLGQIIAFGRDGARSGVDNPVSDNVQYPQLPDSFDVDDPDQAGVAHPGVPSASAPQTARLYGSLGNFVADSPTLPGQVQGPAAGRMMSAQQQQQQQQHTNNALIQQVLAGFQGFSQQPGPLHTQRLPARGFEFDGSNNDSGSAGQPSPSVTRSGSAAPGAGPLNPFEAVSDKPFQGHAAAVPTQVPNDRKPPVRENSSAIWGQVLGTLGGAPPDPGSNMAGILQPLLSLNTLVKMGSLGSVGLHGELPNLASFPPDTQGMGGEGLMQQEPGLAELLKGKHSSSLQLEDILFNTPPALAAAPGEGSGAPGAADGPSEAHQHPASSNGVMQGEGQPGSARPPIHPPKLEPTGGEEQRAAEAPQAEAAQQPGPSGRRSASPHPSGRRSVSPHPSAGGASVEAGAAPAHAGRASPALQIPGSTQSGGSGGAPQLEGAAAAGQKRKETPAAGEGGGEPPAQRPRQDTPADVGAWAEP